MSSADKPSESEVSRLIDQVAQGNIGSTDRLLPLVYDELRTLARANLANERRDNLETAELVHEAYLRMVGPGQRWENRAHFFGAAAEAMRRVLVDQARCRNSQKRDAGRRRVELHDSAISSGCLPEEIIIVNDLFDRLAVIHPNEAQVAKLRYFVGFNNRETSEALGIATSTVHDRWVFSKAWLYREYQKQL